jgi:hypothetical protein
MFIFFNNYKTQFNSIQFKIQYKNFIVQLKYILNEKFSAIQNTSLE